MSDRKLLSDGRRGENVEGFAAGSQIEVAARSSFGFYLLLGGMVVLLLVTVIWIAVQQDDTEAGAGGQGAGPAQTQSVTQSGMPPIILVTPQPVIAEKERAVLNEQASGRIPARGSGKSTSP